MSRSCVKILPIRKGDIMLVGYMGAPCSGKTTLAVNSFTEFKKVSTNCELIVEQARLYIAAKRFESNLLPTDPVELTDTDQMQIFLKQSKAEEVMKYSCGPDTIIISDSSPLNSILYMSDELSNNPNVQEILKKVLKTYDLLFFCHPLDIKRLPIDPNRVHDLDAIKAIQQKAHLLLRKLQSWNLTKIYELIGTVDFFQRSSEANLATIELHTKLLSKGL